MVIVWETNPGSMATDEPMRVPRDIMEAYERRTGFIGLGDFLEKKGRIIRIDDNEAQF